MFSRELRRDIDALSPIVHERVRDGLTTALHTVDGLQSNSSFAIAVLAVSGIFEHHKGFLNYVAQPYNLNEKGFLKKIEEFADICDIPKEIVSDLQFIRVRSNSARHSTPDYSLDISDVEQCVKCALSVVRWYYTKRRPESRWLSTGSSTTINRARSQVTAYISMPPTTDTLIGRTEELEKLDCYWAADLPNVAALVGEGGLGKSSLLNEWIKRLAWDNYRGAESVFVWTFYTNGTDTTDPDSSQFFQEAFSFFGIADDKSQTPGSLGKKLADTIFRNRVLLVLDGLEPFQYPPGTAREGELKDASLATLVRQLLKYNLGLCLITSRVQVADTLGAIGTQAEKHDLEGLSPEDGAKLLQNLGLTHPEADRQHSALLETSKTYLGHCLSLTLLGTYLRDCWGGDLRRVDRVCLLQEDRRSHREHTSRILRSYVEWFEDAGLKDELWILRFLSFFDRPVLKEQIQILFGPFGKSSTESFALRFFRRLGREPVGNGEKRTMSGYTPPTPNDFERWNNAVSTLRKARLIASADITSVDQIDTHAFIREYFRHELQGSFTELWCDGNRTLSEHYRMLPPKFPKTPLEMGWLYLAIAHGCRARRERDAFGIYHERVLRGNQSFSTRDLGLYVADLAAVGCFFKKRWTEPSPSLGDDEKLFVLRTAGFRLRGQTRLEEARTALTLAFDGYRSRKLYLEASRTGRNLCEVLTLMGELAEACRVGEESLEFARLAEDDHQIIAESAAVAVPLHYSGRLDEAEARFRAAEELSAKRTPEYPLLFAVRGYHYNKFLLEQGQLADVLKRTGTTLPWVSERRVIGYGPVDLPLEKLIHGEALLAKAIGDGQDLNSVLGKLKSTAGEMRATGRNEFTPIAILAHARCLRRIGEREKDEGARCHYFKEALDEIDEARAISIKVGMRLFVCECDIEEVMVRRASGRQSDDQTIACITSAYSVVVSTGYRRRTEIVNHLKES